MDHHSSIAPCGMCSNREEAVHNRIRGIGSPWHHPRGGRIKVVGRRAIVPSAPAGSPHRLSVGGRGKSVGARNTYTKCQLLHNYLPLLCCNLTAVENDRESEREREQRAPSASELDAGATWPALQIAAQVLPKNTVRIDKRCK